MMNAPSLSRPAIVAFCLLMLAGGCAPREMVSEVAGQEDAYTIRSDKTPEEEYQNLMLFVHQLQYILVGQDRQRGARLVTIALPVYRPEAGEPPQLRVDLRRAGTGSMFTVSAVKETDGEVARYVAEQLADYLQSGHRPRGTQVRASGGRSSTF